MLRGQILRNRCWTLPALLIVLALLCTLSAGKTIHVGGDDQADFAGIQAAIDAANDGDTVLVAPGDYVITEPISFLGKAITVQAQAGPGETTIRMGTPADPDHASVVIFENNETDASVLEGFTITQGKGRWVAVTGDRDGGGVLFYGSSGVVKDCIVVANSGTRGGGIYFHGSSGVVKDCIVVANSATHGGGVMIDVFSNPILTNCIFSGNLATGPGNRIDGYGGGLPCRSHSLATLTNCTIWGNTALQGGGANCLAGRGLLVTNSILWGNTAIQGNEISLEQAATALSVAYSNVAGGQAGIYVQGEGRFDWVAGNIDAEPMFASPGYWADLNDPNLIVDPNDPNAVWIGGDYHLTSAAGRWDPNSQSWVVDDVTSPCIDAGDPNSLVGDEPGPNGGTVNMGAYGGTAEASLSLPDVHLQWLGHASVKIWTDDTVVYVDPRNLTISPHDATLVLVTHTHGDHYQPGDIGKVSGPGTTLIAPPDVVQKYGKGEPIAPGQTIELAGVPVTGVAAYNPNKQFHPKSRNWVGFVIELASKRIYVAGDTDLTDEMKALEDIDVAILPAGGVYTMNAAEAAEATGHIMPQLAIPYHWGDIVGTLADAQQFAELAQCPVKIMTIGETISLNK